MRKKVKIMGILNITPDSFSDGGKFFEEEKAITHAKRMIAEGADILDIGGESTGPGSKPVKVDEELKRVIPIIRGIRSFSNIPISIDTYKAAVAKQALEAGADIINDVSALRADKDMVKIASRYNCPIILMYSKDKAPHATIKMKKYRDVVESIKKFLEERISFASREGIKRKNIVIDPGMGQFVSSISSYSLELITRLNEFQSLKLPILVGISRKSFLGGEMEDRDKKSNMLSQLAVLNGADIIRTHDVKGLKKTLKNY